MIRRHLRENHQTMPLKERNLVVAAGETYDAICAEDENGTSHAENCGYSKYLQTYPEGLACGISGCRFCCISVSMMEKHLSQKHPTDIKTWSTAPISALFAQPRQKYFRVEIPQPVGGDGKDGDDKNGAELSVVQQLHQNYKEFQHRKKEALAKPPLEVNRVAQTSWDCRTNWSTVFAGKDMAVLCRLASLPQPKDPEHYDRVLAPAVRRYLERCQRGATVMRNHYVLCVLYAIESMAGTKPFKTVLADSFAAYINTWTRFVLYLMRAGRTAEAGRPMFQEATTACLYRLEKLATEVPHGAADPVTRNIEEEVERLSVMMLEQPLANSPTDNPLVYFLGIMGWDEGCRRWKTPASYRPLLSHIVYLLRLMGLEKALPTGKNDQLNHRNVMEVYADTFLKSHSNAVFAEVHSQRMFAKVLADGHNAKPTILWLEGNAVVQYIDKPVRLNDLALWFQAMTDQAMKILLENLVFRHHREIDKVNYLKQRRPLCFTDRLTWANNGESFCTFEDNGLLDGHLRVLEWAGASEHGRKYVKCLQEPLTLRTRGTSV